MAEESREKLLGKMLSIIKKNPGIRPTKLNALLRISHTAGLRNTLIKRGLVRKKREGNAVHYFHT